ncbi:flagellar biosynthetic protein FliO [Paraburkholderia sp. J10-1]|uniref:flagellar biosynthetic protein FliO n=1 Tax=Paraburkholderia sp. J10-1 TaxID=2805430 RepID=UPI002AB7B153|nr:flagellar biosynthetic protein FliO [Paraburkholderia sp. J10-1]
MLRPEVASELAASSTTVELPGHGASASALQSLLMVSGISPLRVVAALILCLIIGVAVILLIRRVGARAPVVRPGRRMRLAETLRLNARTTLYLVELDDVCVLLSGDSAGVRTLLRKGNRSEAHQ